MQIYCGTRFIQPFKKEGGGPVALDTMQGGTPVTLYRYFMLKIYESWGDSTLQFSKMQFIDKDGNNFIYPLETSTEIGKYDDYEYDATCFNGENVENVLVNDNTIKLFGKACFEKNGEYLSKENPIRFKFDLKSQCLNVKTYNRWIWHTSNDTDDYPERNMKRFELFFSNKGDIYDPSCWNSEITGGEQYCDMVVASRELAFTSKQFEI